MSSLSRALALWTRRCVLALVLGSLFLSCEPTREPLASARLITNRSELVGGDRALGDVGDFLLENDKVRIVIQREGYSRGFGVFGGSLIDADLRRPDENGTSGRGSGRDAFGELFPAFFTQACEVDTVQILDNGENGGPARIEASGYAGDFLELLSALNRAAIGSNGDKSPLTLNKPKGEPSIRYATTYELSPGASHVVIRFKVTNITSDQTLEFPSPLANLLLGFLGIQGVDKFTLPVGDVALFGATSKVFLPGAGFDLRFSLEEAYKKKIDFPAFPGLVTEWVAAKADDVSYGLLAEASEDNFVFVKRDAYEDGTSPITPSSMLIPFVASSFIGVFYQNAPPRLEPGQSFEVKKYFVLGSGDVGSVLDEIQRIQGTATGKVTGRVLDQLTLQPTDKVDVLVYQRTEKQGRRIFSQYQPRQGFFLGNLPPGPYSARVVGEGIPASDFTDFDIVAGQSTTIQLQASTAARVVVRVTDESGQPLPAKVTAVGTYGPEFSGQDTRTFLFDLQAGEPYRVTDYVPDSPDDPSTRRYFEGRAFTNNGTAELVLRPGTYEIVSSRGPEYTTTSSKVTVTSGQVASLTHTLRHVVDTRGWISADTHIHSRNSIDSPMRLGERVRSIAAEHVEWAVSTDHNYITDFAPFIIENHLERFLFSSIGLEMTTLESGHFNGYPLSYQVGPVTHGSFQWGAQPPDVIFQRLRELGRFGSTNTLIQVNHPRDQILGYFSQYDRHGLTMEEIPATTLTTQLVKPSGPAFRKEPGNPASETTFSFNFDLLEVVNGKLFWEIRHYRSPEVLPPGEVPDNLPPPGTLLLEADGGDVAFPGVVDDWFNLLNLGYKFIGVGTGDSHSGDDEAGQFRTMVFVGKDDPQEVTELDMVQGLRSRRVLMTNGPMLDFYINDPVKGVMGQTLSTTEPSVQLHYKLSAAPWIRVDFLNIWRNGILAARINVDPNRDLAAQPLEDSITLELDQRTGSARDSWFVVEAISSTSMFPVVLPTELPPLVLTDAVASLAGPLGLGGDEFGSVRPAETFAVVPYALTNPVWITTEAGRDFQPPGVLSVEEQRSPTNDPGFQRIFDQQNAAIKIARKVPIKAESRPGELVQKKGRRRRTGLFYPDADNPYDWRKVLIRMGYGHGHSE